MESPFQSIQTLQRLLSEAGTPSVVIGGVAVGAWGEPRVTRDVDLKVLYSRQEANYLLELLSQDYESLMADPHETLRKQALIFVKDSLGTRMDLLLADTPYDVAAIRRGREVEVEPGVKIWVCSPEDLIIYKLISTRARDYEDARNVIRRQGNLLDDEYVNDWLRQFEQALDDSTLVTTYQRLRG
jgi:hypothetical protein